MSRILDSLRAALGGSAAAAGPLSGGNAENITASHALPSAAAVSETKVGTVAAHRVLSPTSRSAYQQLRDSGKLGKQQAAVVALVSLWPNCTIKQLARTGGNPCLGVNEYERRATIAKRLSELGQPLPSRPRGLGVVMSERRKGERELRWRLA